jgi:membrane protein CcdC involved in cytochrome C biogenesis
MAGRYQKRMLQRTLLSIQSYIKALSGMFRMFGRAFMRIPWRCLYRMNYVIKAHGLFKISGAPICFS